MIDPWGRFFDMSRSLAPTRDHVHHKIANSQSQIDDMSRRQYEGGILRGQTTFSGLPLVYWIKIPASGRDFYPLHQWQPRQFGLTSKVRRDRENRAASSVVDNHRARS